MAKSKTTKSTSKSTSKTTSKATTTPQKTYVVKAGDTGSYADVVNKAQAYLTNGTYTPGQTMDTDWWGSGGGKSQMYGNSKTYKGQAMTTTDFAKALEYANAYDKMIEDQKLAQYQNIDQIYQQMFDAQNAQYAANQEAARQRTAQTIASINANKDNINNDFEKAQKENYINQVIQKNQMGDYMSAMGYTGGMAESTLQGINNNYLSNRQNAISERDSALRDVDRLVAEAQASGNSDLAEIANNHYNNYTNALQNKAQMNYQISQDQQAQANADRDYLLKLRMYNDERNDLASSAAKEAEEQAAANDFDTFLNTYKGKWTKEATYRKWIENLKGMPDPYGYNKQKIAYLTQYINSGMGGKNSSRTYSGGGSPKDEPIDSPIQKDLTNYVKTAKMIANGDAPYIGSTPAYGTTSADQVIDYLEDLYKKGAITKQEVTQIAQSIGFNV